MLFGEYIAIFFRIVTYWYLHVLYQDQLYQPTEAISLESQPIQRQTLGGSSFCPSLANPKVFHMKLTWKWFLGDPRRFLLDSPWLLDSMWNLGSGKSNMTDPFQVETPEKPKVEEKDIQMLQWKDGP